MRIYPNQYYTDGELKSCVLEVCNPKQPPFKIEVLYIKGIGIKARIFIS
ncbi:hypothetical protein [Helicobacter apodemus]|nr:hypothetical protein [Helicobacter apodemus]